MIGAVPYVFIGSLVFTTPSCGRALQPYYDERLGPNVWDYYFRQPSAYQLGSPLAEGRLVRSVQVHPSAPTGL